MEKKTVTNCLYGTCPYWHGGGQGEVIQPIALKPPCGGCKEIFHPPQPVEGSTGKKIWNHEAGDIETSP